MIDVDRRAFASAQARGVSPRLPINANLRGLIRRARGYRDHEYLILKAQKSTAQVRLARAA